MTKDEALKLAQKAMGLIGADLVCEAAHHEKKDRHQIGEPCPIQARWHQAFAAIKEVLAQHDSVQAKPEPEQEPVAWMHWLHGPVQLFLNKDEAMLELERLNRDYPVDAEHRKMRPLVFGDTTPPQRKPLTDEEIQELFGVGKVDATFTQFVRTIEAAHGIKEET